MAAAGRLQGHSAFNRLRVSGQRFRSGPLSASVVFTQESARVGFALPTSLGNAVVRNRLRRRLRATVTAYQDFPDADIIIRPSTSCISLSHEGLQRALVALMTRIAIAAPTRSDEPSAMNSLKLQ